MTILKETHSEPNCESVILDANEVKAYNDSMYQGSYEAEYWRKRLNFDSKRTESYRRFRNKASDKKRHCIKHGDFKREKRWYGYDGRYFDYEEYQYENRGLVKQFAAKNRIYCPDCRKRKVLFESESQANNFIKFNSQDIEAANGYAPIRSYYCPLCCGWHVTSLEESLWQDKPTIAELILKEKQKMKETIAKRATMHKQEPVCQKESEETAREQLLKEIKALFMAEMDVFMDAYKKKDLDSCKAIYDKYSQLSENLPVQDEAITKIKNRIASAKKNIDKLTSILAKEEDKKKKLIWGIQQAFKQKVDTFNQAFALSKINECYNIYYGVVEAISSFHLNMPFMKAIRAKIEIMERKLGTFEKHNTHKLNMNNTLQLFESKILRPAI